MATPISCSVCGASNRIFETCNTPLCSNMICVSGDGRVCAPDEDTWSCQAHGGAHPTQFDANIDVDIQALFLDEQAFSPIPFEPLVDMAFSGYRAGQIIGHHHTFRDMNSLRACAHNIFTQWRPSARRWLVIGTHATPEGHFWTGWKRNGDPWSLLRSDFLDTVLGIG
jgi:hypothetical protein